MQVFDGNGKYETQWVNMHRPCGLYCCRGAQPQFIIGELGPGMSVNRDHPNLGPRLSIVDGEGQAASRGSAARTARASRPGKFIAPHGLAVDSRGDIYVGEVSYTEYPRLFPEQTIPWRMRSLQKLEKLSLGGARLGQPDAESLLQKAEQARLQVAFLEAEVHPRRLARRFKLGIAAVGQHDDRRRRRLCLDALSELKRLGFRHRVRGEHHIGLAPLDQLEGFGRRGGRFDRDRFDKGHQPVGDPPARIELVIDDENPHAADSIPLRRDMFATEQIKSAQEIDHDQHVIAEARDAEAAHQLPFLRFGFEPHEAQREPFPRLDHGADIEAGSPCRIRHRSRAWRIAGWPRRRSARALSAGQRR